MSLCLAAGAVAAVLAVDAFTLAWTHSIEKVRWEEDWRIVQGQLVAVAARIRGIGAGMEPPPDAVLEHGVWRYRPALPAQRHLLLAHTPFTAGYQLCLGAECRPLDAYLPGLDGIAEIEVRACP